MRRSPRAACCCSRPIPAKSRPGAPLRGRRADPGTGQHAMLPVLALVGRPNVGKSTLFNALTGTQDALVADIPGLTRDRKYGFGHSEPWRFIVVDTGGLVESPRGIMQLMAQQTQRAIDGG